MPRPKINFCTVECSTGKLGKTCNSKVFQTRDWFNTGFIPPINIHVGETDLSTIHSQLLSTRASVLTVWCREHADCHTVLPWEHWCHTTLGSRTDLWYDLRLSLIGWSDDCRHTWPYEAESYSNRDAMFSRHRGGSDHKWLQSQHHISIKSLFIDRFF